jgi:DNA-binding NarL/FixJ family response regulator
VHSIIGNEGNKETFTVKKTKILVADDHRVVVEGIKSALRDHPEFEVVGEAFDGREAIEKAKSLRPDIIIMDISMPALNGIDATMQIKEVEPEIQIIIFTMHSDRENIIDLFKAGISAYVLKEDPMSDLVLAIKAVRRKGTYMSGSTPTVLLDHIKKLEESAIQRTGFERLSLREREIFQFLAEGKTIKEVAAKLFISPRTVETHKYSIMQKLDVSSLADLTKIAIKKKLIPL